MFQNRIKHQEALILVLPLPVSTEQASGLVFSAIKWDLGTGQWAVMPF